MDCAIEVDGLCKQFNVPSFPHLTMGSAADYQARNLSQIKVHKQTFGAVDAPHVIAWMVGELKRPEWGIALSDKDLETLKKRSTETDDAASPASKPALSLPLPPPLLPSGVLWTQADVESATIELYQSIAHSSPLRLRGIEKRQALKSLLRLWSLAHPSSGCKEGALSLISLLNKAWPDADSDPQGTALQDHPICGSKALDRYLKTKPLERYVACRGPKEGSRGYTCGLWVTFHTLAAGLPDWRTGDPGLIFMDGIRAFGSHFFLCEECAKHFKKLLESPAANEVKTKRDAIIWTWKTHNIVNERLRKQEVELSSHSNDPSVLKIVFPSSKDCEKCRKDGEDWDIPEVIKFLEARYGPKDGHGRGERGSRAESEAALNNTDLIRDSGDQSQLQWAEEEGKLKASEFSSEQMISSSWAYLEIDLLLTVLGLFLVVSLIISSVCMRRGRSTRLKTLHFAAHASDNV